MKWRSVAIGDISHVVTKGTTPTTSGRPFTDQGIRFIKAEALNGDTYLERNGIAFIGEETHLQLKRSILESNDVLITIAGAQIGKCGYVTPEYLPANTNQAVGIVRINCAKAVPRFVYYFFKQPGTFQSIQSLGGGQAAQPNLNLANLKRITLPLPSLNVQQIIADSLTIYDDLIENNRRRMTLLEDSARLLYNEWFVRLRFPGYEHTRIVDGVPEGWELKTLGEVSKINQINLSGTFDGEIEYIDIASVTPNSINETTRYHFRDAPGRARRVVRHGDIIWSCVRPNRRSHAVIWQPSENLIASTGFAVITPTSLPTSFLYQSVTTDLFIGYLENHAKGAAYPAVVSGDFQRAEILVPSSQLVTAFNAFAEPLLSQSNNLHLQNQKLRVARDLLLPRLMSGEIAV